MVRLEQTLEYKIEEIKRVIAKDPQNSIAKSLAYENIKKIIEERF
jgi:hypothetical protein